jgi:hypothetical protein
MYSKETQGIAHLSHLYIPVLKEDYYLTRFPIFVSGPKPTSRPPIIPSEDEKQKVEKVDAPKNSIKDGAQQKPRVWLLAFGYVVQGPDRETESSNCQDQANPAQYDVVEEGGRNSSPAASNHSEGSPKEINASLMTCQIHASLHTRCEYCTYADRSKNK